MLVAEPGVYPKTIVSLLAIVSLCAAIAACGDSGSGTTTTDPHDSGRTPQAGGARTGGSSTARAPGGYLLSDGDIDPDDQGKSPNDNTPGIKAAGPPANGADRRTIAALVRDYYATALAGDGAKACLLLDSTLATAITVGGSGPRASGPSTCTAALSRLFKQQHNYLASEDPRTMVVTGVYLKNSEAIATLGFKTMPQSEILLEREHGMWKINAVFDDPLL